MSTVLVLGGTGEARRLAAALDADGTRVISSLAGRVSRPALPVGEVRVGGFGGPEGLAAFLRTTDVGIVVDATHPFAARISAHAAAACAVTGVPLVRLQRPGWRELAIHESSPSPRGISALLAREARNYTPTQYFPDQPPGAIVRGIRNEDLEAQSFGDETFDAWLQSSGPEAQVFYDEYLALVEAAGDDSDYVDGMAACADRS